MAGPDGRPQERGHNFSLETLAAPRRPGRAGRNDLFYAEHAAVYADAFAAGSQRPNMDVVNEYGHRGTHFTADYVAKLIGAARARGLLTDPPGPGRPGGWLTEKALALLGR